MSLPKKVIKRLILIFIEKNGNLKLQETQNVILEKMKSYLFVQQIILKTNCDIKTFKVYCEHSIATHRQAMLLSVN